MGSHRVRHHRSDLACMQVRTTLYQGIHLALPSFPTRNLLGPEEKVFLVHFQASGHLDILVLQMQCSELSSSTFLYPSLELATCTRPPLPTHSFQDWSLWYCGGFPRTLPFGRQTREQGQSPEGFHFILAAALPAAITLRRRG